MKNDGKFSILLTWINKHIIYLRRSRWCAYQTTVYTLVFRFHWFHDQLHDSNQREHLDRGHDRRELQKSHQQHTDWVRMHRQILYQLDSRKWIECGIVRWKKKCFSFNREILAWFHGGLFSRLTCFCYQCFFLTHVQANLSNFNWIIKCLLCSSSVITITSRFLIKLNWVNLISRDSRSSMSAEVSNGMSISKAGFLVLSSGFIFSCNYLVAFSLPNTAQKRFLAIQISLDVFSVVWCQWLHISISTCWSSFEFFKESFVLQRGLRCTTCQLSGFLPTSAPPSSLHTLVLRWV